MFLCWSKAGGNAYSCGMATFRCNDTACHTHTHTSTHAHTYTYTHTYTSTHTYKHTYTLLEGKVPSVKPGQKGIPWSMSMWDKVVYSLYPWLVYDSRLAGRSYMYKTGLCRIKEFDTCHWRLWAISHWLCVNEQLHMTHNEIWGWRLAHYLIQLFSWLPQLEKYGYNDLW